MEVEIKKVKPIKRDDKCATISIAKEVIRVAIRRYIYNPHKFNHPSVNVKLEFNFHRTGKYKTTNIIRAMYC